MTVRNRTVYADAADAEDNGTSSRGVVGPCQLKSRIFHPADNMGADVHHDILEGVIPAILKLQ